MNATGLERRAAALLGDGGSVTGWAPGRVTVVGEHVDYVGGLVLAAALDMGIAVALRPASDGLWSVRSGERQVSRDALHSLRRHDIGDRPLAVVAALAEAGIGDVTPLEIAIEAELPSSVGLSSSAALAVATAIAVLRLRGRMLDAAGLAEVAHHAEHDLLGIACGRLDQLTVVMAERQHVLLINCRTQKTEPIEWPWLEQSMALVVCDTGECHDVGGADYAARRAEAEAALTQLGVSDAQAHVTPRRLLQLGEPLRRRARHVLSETARSRAAAVALLAGDDVELGRLMAASHVSLRDDCEVSTARLDAVVLAATAVPGCRGARMVGAGFGGSAVALVEATHAAQCRARMAAAAGVGTDRTWVLAPATGAAAAAPDVVSPPG